MFNEEFDILFKIVFKELKISKDILISKSRKGEVVDARRTIIVISKNNSKLSLAKIGNNLGGRDHSTILNAIKEHNKLYGSDREYTSKFDKVNYAFLSSPIISEKINYTIEQLRARKKTLTKYIDEQIIKLENEKSKKKEEHLNIGLFMGSFNPIHNGHMVIANTALYQCNFDEVWFVVSPESPDKIGNSDILDFDSRVDLISSSIIDNPLLKVCTIEKDLSKPSYTINTIKELEKIYKNYKFSLILGTDNIENIDTWKGHLDIINNYPIYSFERHSSNKKYLDNFNKFKIKEIKTISISSISSTEIRNILKEGKNIEQLRYLIPDECLFLIEKKGYYKKQTIKETEIINQ
jgi:nicotinate-nucleotide adenylyltransferase